MHFPILGVFGILFYHRAAYFGRNILQPNPYIYIHLYVRTYVHTYIHTLHYIHYIHTLHTLHTCIQWTFLIAICILTDYPVIVYYHNSIKKVKGQKLGTVEYGKSLALLWFCETAVWSVHSNPLNVAFCIVPFDVTQGIRSVSFLDHAYSNYDALKCVTESLGRDSARLLSLCTHLLCSECFLSFNTMLLIFCF